MPIIFFPNTQGQIVARGQRLKWRHRICMALGIPFDVQAFKSDDTYTLSKYLPPVLQIDDDTAAKRVAMAQAQAEAERKRNPNPNREPKKTIPGGPK